MELNLIMVFKQEHLVWFFTVDNYAARVSFAGLSLCKYVC